MERTVIELPRIPKLKARKRVCAYARVSSGKDAMLHSLSAQVSFYSEKIQAQRGWEYAGVYTDEAITGTKGDRAGFQRMLADCRAGKIDLIITKSISRFARNTVTLLETVRSLKEQQVDVFFEEQNIHTMSSDGELMLTILASYAQEESRSVSENQKWRIKKNFEAGIPWSPVMLGYRLVGDCFKIVPDEAETVKRIFSEYLAGAGVNAIAKGLTADKILPRRGKVWRQSTISEILRNYNYTGNLMLQKTYRENCLTKISVANDGQLPQYHAEDSHEAIIDIETYEAVQNEIKRREALYGPKTSCHKTYPYTGLLVCAKCGKHYQRKVAHTRVVWMCSTYNKLGKKYCASKAVPEIVLDELSSRFENIKKIEADDGNVLRFYLPDGHIETMTWTDPSRSESWTEEKREAARQRAYERREK